MISDKDLLQEVLEAVKAAPGLKVGAGVADYPKESITCGCALTERAIYNNKISRIINSGYGDAGTMILRLYNYIYNYNADIQKFLDCNDLSKKIVFLNDTFNGSLIERKAFMIQ